MEADSHAKHSDFGTGSFFHASSPENTEAYSLRNISGETADRTASVISAGDGQISWRKTGFPFLSLPSGSVYGSKSTSPARAYATTSIGDAR